MKQTLSQNGRFSTKRSGQFRGPTKDALLHSHVNRVTFSLTSTLPMANSGCLRPVIVAGRRGGRPGVVKSLLITCYGVIAHRQYRVFDGGVAGALAGPLHWRAGWQTGSLARPIA
jgi:hypothetical protein